MAARLPPHSWRATRMRSPARQGPSAAKAAPQPAELPVVSATSAGWALSRRAASRRARSACSRACTPASMGPCVASRRRCALMACKVPAEGSEAPAWLKWMNAPCAPGVRARRAATSSSVSVAGMVRSWRRGGSGLRQRDHGLDFDGDAVGQQATPTALRAWRPASPNTLTIRSDAPFAMALWRLKSGAAATNTPRRTMRATPCRRSPVAAASCASTPSAAWRAACTPSSSLTLSPRRPRWTGLPSTRGTCPEMYRRLPSRTNGT